MNGSAPPEKMQGPPPANKSAFHRLAFCLALLLAIGLSACQITRQIAPSGRSHNVSLQKGDLRTHGLGFITPSTVEGKEVDRQALAMILAAKMTKERPQIPLVPLSETLGHTNRNGLAETYKKMLMDYRYTGVFEREALQKVGEATGVRYLAQIKLAEFNQKSKGRLSLFGLRIIQTKVSNVRLFLSIWDSWDGSIVWEGMQETHYAYDTIWEKPVSFKQAVAEASRELISRMP
ncbi:MAG: hypothetical protein C0617_13005 [Desulfuromonas sp.]|uniref:hypothetical protein n=1 Tax=Desulfuromonas sp. TaxID=892 RepID=UPI000CAC265C|nr:hypothetical protein [Desulfuromonas sp.]PLX83005.1 MAG: hypothetical protein C0617_13005 [Desulfuromonas sp.]